MSPKMILAYLKKGCLQRRWKNGDRGRAGGNFQGSLGQTVCYLKGGKQPGLQAQQSAAFGYNRIPVGQCPVQR